MRFIMIETKHGNVAINPQKITSICPHIIGDKISKYVFITLGEVTLDTKFTDVESAVDSHEAVLESAMIPSPDAIRGEIVKVFVVLRDGYEPSEKLVREIQKHVKEVTAPYKYPREIEFVKELPKTISGKIRRKELRISEFETKKDVIEKLKEKGLWQRAD